VTLKKAKKIPIIFIIFKLIPSTSISQTMLVIIWATISPTVTLTAPSFAIAKGIPAMIKKPKIGGRRYQHL
jgi:hypothetical protein